MEEAHQKGVAVTCTRDPCKVDQITAALDHELLTTLQMLLWEVSQFCVALVFLVAPTCNVKKKTSRHLEVLRWEF